MKEIEKKHLMTRSGQMMSVLALSMLMVACGGSSSSTDEEIEEEEEHEHEHAGGRLFYSLSNTSGLAMFDQTVETDQFSTGVVTTSGTDAELVLSKEGLTFAMLDSGAVYIVNAGLDHLEEHDEEEGDEAHEEEGHTHDPESMATELTSGVTMVVATHGYFSAFDGSTSTVIHADEGETETTWMNVEYPTLALSGDHYLTFTADGTDVAIEVVEANGESLETPVTLACTDSAVLTSAQSEEMTQILCDDGTLLTLIAETGDTDIVFTTDSDADSGFNQLTATYAEGNVIAGWNDSSKLLVLTKAHGDHAHSLDVTDEIESDQILSVAATSGSEENVLGVLGDDGRFYALTYHAEEHDVELEDTAAFTVDSQATWAAPDQVLAGEESFLIVNTGNSTLYYADAHDGSSYHVHSEVSDDSLATLSSAVLAHGIEHDHDGDDEDHDH